jgi:hypothetical protein
MKDCRRNKNAKMSIMEHPSIFYLSSVVSAQGSPAHREAPEKFGITKVADFLAIGSKERKKCLG